MVLGGGPLGGDEVMRVQPHDEICALMKETPQNSLPLPPCEDPVGRQPSVKQEVGLQQTPYLRLVP